METDTLTRSKGTEIAKPMKSAYALIIVSLLLLCNVNIGIIDILPDAIAYFMLAKVFFKASLQAPFFEEAREAFLKLGWINLAKLPALFVIAASRAENAFGNDTSVVISFIFCVLEIIFLIPAIKNIFAALFRLGERTDAASLIRPFGKRGASPEWLLVFTYIFMIGKCIFAAAPELFTLTRTSEDGFGLKTISIGYPITLVIAQAVGLVLGTIWLLNSIKYAKAVHNEGQFNYSLDVLVSYDPDNRFAVRRELRTVKLGLTLLTVAAFFTIDVNFDNTLGINLLPDFIYGVLLMVALGRLKQYLPENTLRRAYISGIAYTFLSAMFFGTETYFLYYFGYDELLRDGIASKVYLFVEATAAVQFIVLVIFLSCIASGICSFVYNHTGIPPSHERYSRADKDYHKGLCTRVNWYLAIGILTGAAKLIDVISRATVEMIFTQSSQVAYFPALEWMGLVVTACAVLLIGFSIYLFSTLKEECEMKYIQL